MTTDTTTPAPATPEAATAQILALRTSSDPAARAEIQRLEAIEQGMAAPAAATPPAAAPAVGTPPAVDHTARDAARAALAAKKADPAAVKRYLGGDSTEKAEWLRLQEAADPGHVGDGKSIPDEGIEATVAAAAGDDAVPSEPGRYRFDYAPGLELDKQLDTEFRQMAHTAKLPEPIARYAFKFWNKAAADAKKVGKGPSDGELQLKTASTAAKLQARWGDRYQAKLDAANSIIRALPEAQRTRAVRMLERSGLGADEHFIVQLADLAARRAAAKK